MIAFNKEKLAQRLSPGIFALNIIVIICLCLTVVSCLFSFIVYKEINLMPLANIFSGVFGLDIGADCDNSGVRVICNMYLSLIRWPLLFWMFVISIPSFIGIYRKMDKEHVKD